MTLRDAFIAGDAMELRAREWLNKAGLGDVRYGCADMCNCERCVRALAALLSASPVAVEAVSTSFDAVIAKWDSQGLSPRMQDMLDDFKLQIHNLPQAASLSSRREVLEEARRYAVHKTKCRAWPAFSEEQILRDCDCGYVTLFGWSSGNVGALSAAPPAGVGEKEPEWCELCGHTGWLRDADGNRTERCPCTPVSELEEGEK